jgi:hypothetical protein
MRSDPKFWRVYYHDRIPQRVVPSSCQGQERRESTTLIPCTKSQERKKMRSEIKDLCTFDQEVEAEIVTT